MTLFSSDRLLISLPAAELAGVDLPGSLLTHAQVSALKWTHALGCAISLVEANCAANNVATTYLARPEIFTHGMAETWLRRRLGTITQHLCISDASTIKHVPGCRTHMFLYRLAYHDSFVSFSRLCRRTPELLGQVASQINTRFSLGCGADRHQPLPIYLHAVEPPAPPPARAYPFHFSPHLTEQTAERVVRATPTAVEALPEAADTTYIPLTETALNDPDFMRFVAHRVRAAFLHGNTLLLRPPDRAGEALAARIAQTLSALAGPGVILPRHTPATVFFLSHDLTAETAPPSLTLLVHESFDFWRHPPSFYAQAEAVIVAASAATLPEPDFLPLDVTRIYGPRATRQWLQPREP